MLNPIITFFSSLKNIAYVLLAGIVIYTIIFVKQQNNEISELKEVNFELRNSNVLANLDVNKLAKINSDFKTVFDRQNSEINKLKEQINFERSQFSKKEVSYKDVIKLLQKDLRKESMNPSSVIILKKCEIKITEIDEKPPDDTRKFLIKLNTIGD